MAKPKMVFYPEIKALIASFQEKWRELDNIDVPDDAYFAKLDGKAGERDRAADPGLYAERANNILNYFALKLPGQIEEIIGQYDQGSYLPAMLGVHGKMSKMVKPMGHYLDDHHCVVHVLNESLYHKAVLTQWLFTEFVNFKDRYPGLLPPILICIIGKFFNDEVDPVARKQVNGLASVGLSGLIKLMPTRRRLSTLTQRIDDYDNGLSYHSCRDSWRSSCSIDEVDCQPASQPPAANVSEPPTSVPVDSEKQLAHFKAAYQQLRKAQIGLFKSNVLKKEKRFASSEQFMTFLEKRAEKKTKSRTAAAFSIIRAMR